MGSDGGSGGARKRGGDQQMATFQFIERNFSRLPAGRDGANDIFDDFFPSFESFFKNQFNNNFRDAICADPRRFNGVRKKTFVRFVLQFARSFLIFFFFVHYSSFIIRDSIEFE